MTFFAPKKLQGVVYELSHLTPFRFNVPVDEKIYVIRVEFTCHCFTAKLEPHHGLDVVYEHKSEKRAFDIQRHELSKLLPDYIRGLVSNSVYWSNKGSFFFWRTPQNTAYLVFFSALKSRTKGIDVQIKIMSAHPKPQMAKYASPIDFTELMKVKANGEFPEFGPKVQIKRK